MELQNIARFTIFRNGGGTQTSNGSETCISVNPAVKRSVTPDSWQARLDTNLRTNSISRQVFFTNFSRRIQNLYFSVKRGHLTATFRGKFKIHTFTHTRPTFGPYNYFLGTFPWVLRQAFFPNFSWTIRISYFLTHAGPPSNVWRRIQICFTISQP